MKAIFFLCVLSLPLLAFSQTSEKYNGPYTNFYRAEELFEKEQYAAARKEFRTFIDDFHQVNDPMYIKARYYEGISALELYNNDAVDLLKQFNADYPESIYRQTIYFKVGKYYYQKKEFATTLYWFNQMDKHQIEPKNKEEYYFKLGYANFQEKKIPEAKTAFYEIKNDSTQYGAPALYYFSHICYAEKAYQPALEGFEKLKRNPQFSKAVPYYIAQIYYLQGKYQEVADYAPSLSDSSQLMNKRDLNHLIGDAYSKIGKYDEAIPYLEKYGKEGKPTREDHYHLAYAYYRTLQYTKAIPSFDKVTKPEDSLGQMAYYHIGECYLQMKNLASARAAFEAASKISMNEKIKEDALYNFAVLSFKLDINPYDEAVEAFQLYLNTYPNSERQTDIYNYLVNVYTSTNNYKKALESLQKVSKKDARLKGAYQIVSYNYGVELFTKDQYKEAIEAFKGVEEYNMDPSISAKAKFWTADAYFKSKNYSKAIQEYKTFIGMPNMDNSKLLYDAYYNIGYANLYNGDTLSSIENFRMYTKTKSTNKSKLADAYMRVGDGLFTLKEDANAIKNYQAAYELKAGNEDQALFYMAKSSGYLNKQEDKVKFLLDLINNHSKSKYTIIAIYEVAMTLKGLDEFDKSLKYFDMLINDYPQASYIISARLEKADILFKQQLFKQAEMAYQTILNEYGQSTEICGSASRGLVEIYKAQNNVDKVNELAEKYPCANVTSDEKEDMYYAPALRFYNDSNYVRATEEFEKYITRFPEGKFIHQARMYQANAYFSLNQKDKAVELYRIALNSPTSLFTEFASARVAQYLYNGKKYEEALIYYQKLDEVASTPEKIYAAKLGLMRCNFLLENYESTIPNADYLLGTNLTSNIKIEANYSKGIACYTLKRFEDAKPALAYIFKNTTTSMAAECKVALADIAYQLGDYKTAETEAKAVVKMKPAYNYWIAKSLMLQAKISVANNDLFTAEQTLTSILEHYSKKDDGILEEAQAQFEELQQLKNKSKSVQPEPQEEIEIKGN